MNTTDPPPGTTPARCGVVGGGRMGAGIAHALLLAGAEVVLVERDQQAAAAAVERVEHALAAGVARGRLDDAAPVLARLTTETDPARLAGVALVIEAVPEDLDLKLDTFGRIARHVAADTVIASNTSSISLDVLADAVPHPERVIGLHFFNPVPASKLVEVVLGGRTSADLRDRAEGWVREWGKTPVTVRNAPGFASSRLGVAIGLEAIRMLEEGIATAEDIDAAMTLGYGFPMGPLRLTDLVGIDVRLGIARYLEQELGPRFAPPGLMIDMVERGDLGRKTGRGFYDWPENS
ncbi:3-hydroxyacyl-CoA dehydrogenase family protein [Nonomuraea insulae]|uniref:3-hydroxyacyl-CoA dehydrogenase family protein n=1 Tax=Nonomuraea insulae TaxID=1616787 RepID=A0ABW1DC41_9ACTN